MLQQSKQRLGRRLSWVDILLVILSVINISLFNIHTFTQSVSISIGGIDGTQLGSIRLSYESMGMSMSSMWACYKDSLRAYM